MGGIFRSKNRMSPVKCSAYSGKIVNGSEVILVSEAVEFVSKIGYIVLRANEDLLIKYLESLGYTVISNKTIFDK